MSAQEIFEACLEWRGIENGNECVSCGGSGKVVYGNTSTWRRGIGGQALTMDVCDVCWGSGDYYKPWPSWRKK